jgi:hypothetical protein
MLHKGKAEGEREGEKSEKREGRMKGVTLMAAALLLSVGSSGGQEYACMRGLNEYYSG